MRILPSKLSLLYQSDIGSGRCRLHDKTFESLGINIGNIVKWKVNKRISDNQIVQVEYLTTAWPDSQECLDLEMNCAIFDDSVRRIVDVHSFSAMEHVNITEESIAQVIAVYPCRICRSMEILHDKSIYQSAHFSGLPIYSNFTICKSQTFIKIGKVNSNDYSLILADTIVINDRNSLEPSNSNSNSNSISSSTIAVREIIQRVVNPYCHKSVNRLCLTCGILLVGPPGTGKTFAVKAVQSQCSSYCKIRIVDISIPNLLSSENPIKSMNELVKFEQIDTVSLNDNVILTTPEPSQAKFSFSDRNYSSTPQSNHSSPYKTPTKAPAKTEPEILFIVIDEIDALGQSNNQSNQQIVIKQELYHWFDRISAIKEKSNIYHCIIATSNRSQDIDISFRRGGRLESEIEVYTSTHDRYIILQDTIQYYHSKLNSDNTIDIQLLASMFSDRTGGYVAADLIALIGEAYKYLQSTSVIDMCSWKSKIELALTKVSPSCLRGIKVDVPTKHISYSDIIGCVNAKNSLRRIFSFADPSKKSIREHFNIQALGGALLYGPPGNSKTRLVMASAAEYNLPLISLSAADVYSPYVGDAEAEIRKAFTIARQGSPCILFLDELDALVSNRGTSSGSSSSNVESRVLATLLNEMDGICTNKGDIIVLAATNRLNAIDAALLRKGRFQHLLYVAPPTIEESIQILDLYMKKTNIPDTSRQKLSSRLYMGISGAEIENICREEKLTDIRNTIQVDIYAENLRSLIL